MAGLHIKKGQIEKRPFLQNAHSLLQAFDAIASWLILSLEETDATGESAKELICEISQKMTIYYRGPWYFLF